MSHHLVLGAGGIGRATTARLVERGHTVTLASRSGQVTDRQVSEKLLATPPGRQTGHRSRPPSSPRPSAAALAWSSSATSMGTERFTPR